MLYVFLYISELLVSVLYIEPESYKNSVARYSLQFKAERRRVNISLGSLRCLHYGESKLSLYSRLFVLFECTFCAPHPF